MNLEMEVQGDNLIIKLSGELDHHSTESARRKIDQYYIDKRLQNIILDLRKITFMDSAGIGLIMGRYKNVLENKGKMNLVSENKSIDRILKMSGLLKITESYPNTKLALENIVRGDK